MAPQKRATAKQPSFTALPIAEPSAASTRKPWIKKTPVDVVLDQISKQEKKVAEMRAAIVHEERELAKLNKAKAVLEAE